MAAETVYDYYYGDESSQFSFYRIPRQLITGDCFKRLSTDAKLLYGLLLDRMSLSAKNGWYDKQGRVYIYYTLDEIQEDMNCGHDKATKLLVELDNGKNGFGLIERVRQGQGRPTKIYVKRFTTRDLPPPDLDPETGTSPGLRRASGQDCGKSARNYIKSNQTENSQLNQSILPLVPPRESGWIDRYDCEKEIEANIEYSRLCRQFACEDVDEIVALIVDTLCATRPTVRIGGDYISAVVVRERFLLLTYEHLEYVFDCLRRNTTEIRNIRAYLLTALYNAPATINHHYQAEVQHDLDG